jgi:hypothetical protein
MEHDAYMQEMGPPSAPVFLDASILDGIGEYRMDREDVRFNTVEFEFPSGLTRLDLLEECRALCDIENFDVMYDITMQMLAGKDLVINLKDGKGGKTCLDRAHITDKMMDMRSVDAINEWPVLMNWLVDFVGGMLLRKFPTERDAADRQPKTDKR